MKYRLRRNVIRTKQTVETFTRLNEGPWRWSLGIQAGISTGVPLALFIMLGYPSYGTIASLGALMVLYGANRLPKERLLLLPLIGVGLGLSSFLGVISAGYEWLSFVCLITITAVASVITSGAGVGPPGPVMFVLVAAVSSQLASPYYATHLAVDKHIIPLLVGAGAALAWVMTAVSYLFPFIRKGFVSDDAPPLTLRLKLSKEDWLVITRVTAGVIAAILLSKPLGIHRVHWVIVAVTAILQAGFGRNLTTIRAMQRVLGTVLGVVVFEAIYYPEPFGIWVIIIIILLQFATQVVIARNYVLGLLFITPMALMLATMSQAGNIHITTKERIVDTLVGAGLAIVVFWVEEIIYWLMGRGDHKVQDAQ